MHVAFALPPRADAGGNGGLTYARGMAKALRSIGHDVDVSEGNDPSFPADAVPVIDGLLLPHLMPRLPEVTARRAVAVIHHVSARAGRDTQMRAAVGEIERAMLPKMRRVIATSQPVAKRLAQMFGVEAPAVVSPGMDELPQATPGDGATQILSAGVLTPRKGHDLLLRALSSLTDLSWTLTIAGSSVRDPVHAGQLQALVGELGLVGRAEVVADPDEDTMDQLWRTAGLFALATRWEGYPAAVAEALRRGIPVVVTAGGAAGDLVPGDAGVVCALDDLPTLSKCLRRVLFDHRLRADLAAGAWHAGQGLPDWLTQARLFERALEG